jgi:hypothetical protein
VALSRAAGGGRAGPLTGPPRPGRWCRLTVGLVPRYKAALLAASLSLPGLALAEKVAGAILPDEATRIGENRFRVARSYEETLKFYRGVYPPRFTRRPIADTPSVKAVHIENPDARPGQWEGLNVYELKNETRVFVLVKPK